MGGPCTGAGLREVAQAFSGPQLPMAGDLPEYIVAQHGAALLKLFLQFHHTILEARNPALVAFLEQAAQEDITFGTCWRPSFGLLETYLQQGVTDPATLERLAVSLAWDLAITGSRGSWSSSVAPMNALLADERLLPPAQRLAVDTDGDTLQVNLDGQPLDFTLPLKAGSEDRADIPAGIYPRVDGALLLTGGMERSYSYREIAKSVLPESDIGQAVEKHREGMALLRRYAPEYARWVSRVVHSVIPLQNGNGRINSGSSRSEPGVIHATIDCGAEGYAEMLVHEATHQYYYILRRMGALEDGSDPTLYYSPVKQTGRPIAMILLAYHAFANVVLMGRRISAAGYSNARRYFPQNDDFLMPILQQLREGLVTTTALTELGTALWEPLDLQLGGGA